MKKSIRLAFALSCIALLVVSGCRKKETVEVDNETQSAVDNAVADQEYAGIVPTVNNHAINTKGAGANGGKMAAAPCDALNWLNQSGPYGGYPQADTSLTPSNKYVKETIYELDLSTTCPQSFADNKVRSGKWNIRITGPLKFAGNQMILKLINHKASGISYSCDSMIVTTVETNTLYTKYNVKLVNGVCQTASWNIKYKSDRTFTVYFKGKPSGSDPVTEIYGTAEGTNRQGRTFTVNIPSSSPIVKHKSCQYIDKGILELIPKDFAARTIDFGNGNCDDDATFTVNGNTVGFKLK